MEKIAVVRIRGVRNIKPKLRKTMELLGVARPNHCVVVDASPQTLGMVALVKDYVTYGKVDEETVFLLLSKRGEKGSKSLSSLMKESELKSAAKEIVGGKKVRDFADIVFRLKPARRGLKNTKTAFPVGELGKRNEMDSLIRRMV